MDYCDVFNQLFGLSFWRHPFTAEHTLVSKWCNNTFLEIWWRIYILDGMSVSNFTFLGEIYLFIFQIVAFWNLKRTKHFTILIKAWTQNVLRQICTFQINIKIILSISVADTTENKLPCCPLPPTTLKRSTVYMIQNSARLKLVEETLSWHCFHMDEIKTSEIPRLWHSLEAMEVTSKPSWEENAALKRGQVCGGNTP